MTFPRRPRFALFLICCMQLLYANVHTQVTSTIATTQENTSTTTNCTTIVMCNNTESVKETYTTETPMTTTTKATALATMISTSTKVSSTTANCTTIVIKIMCNNTESVKGTYTMETPMPATIKATALATMLSTSTKVSASATVDTLVSTPTKASTTATVESTSTKASTTATVESTSTNAAATATTVSISTTYSTTKAPVTTSPSMSTMRNVSFSIGSGTEYSSPDCKSCSNGGTITVTMSCSIKINGSDDKKCDKEKFKETSCDYVTLTNKGYRCAQVEDNYTNYVDKEVNIIKDCDDVCPASGSVLSPHLVFILSSVLAVGRLLQ